LQHYLSQCESTIRDIVDALSALYKLINVCMYVFTTCNEWLPQRYRIYSITCGMAPHYCWNSVRR